MPRAVGRVLQLTDPLDLDASLALRSWLEANRDAIERVTVIGGNEALTPAVADQIAQALRG